MKTFQGLRYVTLWISRKTGKVKCCKFVRNPRDRQFAGRWHDSDASVIISVKTGKVLRSFGEDFRLRVAWAARRREMLGNLDDPE